MIQTITHKGLRLFFEKGSGSKLPAEYLTKIGLILDALDAVSSEEDIIALGAGIHRLTGIMLDSGQSRLAPTIGSYFGMPRVTYSM
jgi:hypothetical protein